MELSEFCKKYMTEKLDVSPLAPWQKDLLKMAADGKLRCIHIPRAPCSPLPAEIGGYRPSLIIIDDVTTQTDPAEARKFWEIWSDEKHLATPISRTESAAALQRSIERPAPNAASGLGVRKRD